MDHLSTQVDQQPKKEQLEWRRARVLELSSQGRTEREIATILRVGAATIARDLSFLHKQARDNLKSHIHDQLPAQYFKCQSGPDQVLKIAWNMIITDSVNQSNKLQALTLISDCYRYQLDLSTNAGIIEQAMRFSSSNTELLNKMIIHKGDNNDKTESLDGNGAAINESTTNGVF
jgi:hypothetical protein